jgi:hypothetical protein
MNRRKLQHLMPQLPVNAAATEQLTQHLVAFALAGLSAIARRRAPR